MVTESSEMLPRVGVMHTTWPQSYDMYPLSYSGYRGHYKSGTTNIMHHYQLWGRTTIDHDVNGKLSDSILLERFRDRVSDHDTIRQWSNSD